VRVRTIQLTAIALLLAAPLAAQSDSEREVRAALDHYLQGHATGDGAHFVLVFHPTSMLTWVSDGTLQTRTSEAYIAGASGQPAADEAERQRRIVMVDVEGDAAMAKVELDYPRVRFVDYFTLLKVEGRWQIMNKTFTREMKPAE
jgi:hypothetical protein